ncbi:glycosyltransferase [Iningainema tapete]|uniref:Glycosyltransferase n=1 Tax=Iningainema tapete BLCC-T55 TaxID=2748662 RepID=A0A8J6XGH5_9CYAN|nr:glycosyltransferase [Iningainema tapete]MBD2771551.1 glycosyltransferase [Iningainema tapete BLCC-T55]
MPRVTVCIPSYNLEKFIGEAIQSVLNQTYQDFEIIIVDDASTDASVSVIKSFKDPRIKLFCLEKNHGASTYGSNKCRSEAQGEFLAQLGADDVFAPDKLEKQVRFLDQNPEVGAVFSYAQIIDESGNDLADENNFFKHIYIQPNRTRFEWLNHFFFKGNCLCYSGSMIRKKCYDQIGKFDPRYAQLPDYEYWIRFCMKYEIHIIQKNLIKRRIRNNEANISGNRPETRIRYNFELAQILKHYLKDEIYDNFPQIFPNPVYKEIKFKKELFLFVIGSFALMNSGYAHRYFGLTTIFEAMEEQNIAQILEDECHFSYKDLIKLTGLKDVFSIIAQEKLQAQLQAMETNLDK